jgi:putative transposase
MSDCGRHIPYVPQEETMSRSMETLAPKDRGEELAMFRAQVLGPLLARPLTRGELAEGLRALAGQRFMPPGALVSRSFAVPTLQQWYYAYRRYGLEGLVPVARKDRGAARTLTDAQRALICAIRREHPTASAELIVRTLEQDGRLEAGKVSASTVRRLFLEQGLDKASLVQGTDGTRRMRWEAAEVDALWHADVCHGPTLQVDGRKVPLRIHALLDDKSRYIVAIQAAATEREQEMLLLVTKALRRWHPPKTLYLDNGATYSGRALMTACGRLGISLVHAKPYDPQARGKMERFWRTLREGCLDHISPSSTLHDVQVRLLAFLDTHYHVRGHGSLMGKSPQEVYETGRCQEPSPVTESYLAAALTVHGKRRVKRDGTIEIGGVVF